jgi:hypothetical protein
VGVLIVLVLLSAEWYMVPDIFYADLFVFVIVGLLWFCFLLSSSFKQVFEHYFADRQYRLTRTIIFGTVVLPSHVRKIEVPTRFKIVAFVDRNKYRCV